MPVFVVQATCVQHGEGSL